MQFPRQCKASGIKKRSFLTPKEKDEQDKFDKMDDMVNATKEVFISESNWKTMAAEGEEVESVDTQLIKNGAPPPKLKPNEK